MARPTFPRRLVRCLSGASLISLASLAACDEAVSPAQVLDVALTMDRTAIAPGDSVAITFGVINRGSEPVTLVGNSCLLRFLVRDAEGNDVVGPHGCADLEQTVVIGPGESFEITQTWYGLTPVYGPKPDGTGSTFLRHDPVPPGTYTVTVRLDAQQVDFERPAGTLTIL